MVIEKQPGLKYSYSFPDFLYYIGLLAIPVVTAFTVVLDRSGAAALIYLLVLLGSVPVMLRFFCTHCPHYCSNENTLKCIFFWGLPKLFRQRTGPLSMMEKCLSVSALALVILFPVYWMLQTPGLFIIYLLSIVLFGASVRRNECPRCIYTACPANRVRQH
jgi:hypothetical protein